MEGEQREIRNSNPVMSIELGLQEMVVNIIMCLCSSSVV